MLWIRDARPSGIQSGIQSGEGAHQPTRRDVCVCTCSGRNMHQLGESVPPCAQGRECCAGGCAGAQVVSVRAHTLAWVCIPTPRCDTLMCTQGSRKGEPGEHTPLRTRGVQTGTRICPKPQDSTAKRGHGQGAAGVGAHAPALRGWAANRASAISWKFCSIHFSANKSCHCRRNDTDRGLKRQQITRLKMHRWKKMHIKHTKRHFAISRTSPAAPE